MTCDSCGRPVGVLASGLVRPFRSDADGRRFCADRKSCESARWAAERRGGAP